jgi:hypothetical protein
VVRKDGLFNQPERMRTMRRKILLGVIALCCVLPNTGCLFLNRYDSDPNTRMNQLLNESEDLRQARLEMQRFWMNNQPSVLTYERLNGAIGP